ncbi:MAG TPA: AAA family ATPase [Gemmatimonadales bacterium]|nr:AAA family ATPase [Gemmatimonadales bacterium]
MARTRAPFITTVSLKRETVPSFREYPFCIPAIRHLRDLRLPGPVTFFLGENGTGKSTLLEAVALASGFNAEGGSKHFRFSTRPSHSVLHEHLRLVRTVNRPRDGYFLRAESFYNVVTAAETEYGVLDAYGGRSLHEQSHGESFMALVLQRLHGRGLYLFDEPEAALSPTRQLSLLAAMHALVDQGSQFLIATHSPILLGYPDATIYLFAEEGISRVAYDETDHYIVTKSFLENPRRMLRELLVDPTRADPPDGAA